MADLLQSFGREVKPLSRGVKLKGIVISKSKNRLVLDIDRKSEGLVAEKAFSEAKDYIKTLEIGDVVTTSVIISETPDGYTILSLRGAQQDASWEKIIKAKSEDKVMVVLGKSVNPSGVMVEAEGLIGFIPNSQLGKEVSEDTKTLIGEHFKVKVIDVNREANKIVFSEKEVSEEEDIKLIKKALQKIEVNKIYEGRVSTITNFGCFVKIDISFNKKKIPVEGLVHISELSWQKVENINNLLKEGDEVKVKVIGVEENKLALSIKQAKDDPWIKAIQKYKVDSKHKGKVVRVSDFGVFVQLEPGVEGLVHMTKIPPDLRLSKGEEVNVYVEEIDSKSKKLSLGLVLTAKPVGYK